MNGCSDDVTGIGWHDNLIYSVHFDVGDPAAGEWRTELVLDIDYVTEWLCGADGRAMFRVAPATLTFHDVADLSIAIDFGGRQFPHTLNELSIGAITKEMLPSEKAPGRMRYWRWRIALNVPDGGEIAFGASGYTQTLRAEPILTENQRLLARERARLMLHRDETK